MIDRVLFLWLVRGAMAGGLIGACLGLHLPSLLGQEPVASATPRWEESPITDSDRDHWAFRPVENPSLPAVIDREWPTNAIDYFVLEGLEAMGLAPAPSADRVTLLRRMKYDLVGLPPTDEEVRAFIADDRSDYYEAWIDAYLASPRYGERWAQPWLDLARFAETDGFEHDRVRKDAWRYRDWVIAALNGDLAYDRFIYQQLAGETDADPEQHIATMFGLAGPDMPDLNDQALRRHDRLNELTSTVASALLGLQFHCAQCHDHKYDPISQGDFYRLRAIFESAVPDLERDKPFIAFSKTSPRPSTEPRFYVRGELRGAAEKVPAAMPRIVTQASVPIRYCSSERPRADFAEWLFEPDHPLTGRVIVNRLWQAHFGRGLFENPSDVGVMYGDPVQRKLLDWLAHELRRQNWSLKSLHRMMVLSSTYRQASRGGDSDSAWKKRIELDPENRYLSRFTRRRLEAEVIRDAMLSAAGLLHFQSGGESVMPSLPEELIGTLLKGQWKTSDEPADHARRSIYIFARRNLRYPLFEVFDRPDGGASCPKRDRSTTATQALQMLNSQLSYDCSLALCERWVDTDNASIPSAMPDEQILDPIFVAIMNRYPTATERQRIQTFCQASQQGLKADMLTVCLALMNTSEFIYID